MKITPKALIISGTALLFTSWLFFKPKKALSATQQRNISSISLIGDSQTKRHLGDAYAQVFSDLRVEYFGKEGATHETYLQDKELLLEIEKLSCSDVIVIQLGDNGVPNRKNSIQDFVDFISKKCPHAQIYWGGPMKAVKPTVNSSYVVTDDTSSPRYLPTYNSTRKLLDERLQEALSETKARHISNFDLQTSQNVNSDFSDRRKGDGVHLTKDSALELSRLHRNLILGDSHAEG